MRKKLIREIKQCGIFISSHQRKKIEFYKIMRFNNKKKKYIRKI